MDLPGDNTGFNRVTNAIGEVTNHLADAEAARAANVMAGSNELGIGISGP